MRKRRYDEGGDVEDMYSDYGSKSGRGSAGTSQSSSEVESDRGAPGTSETVTPSPRAASKPNIVTKEELEKSGLSLRDYMNKQQGLTRRGESSPSAAQKPTPESMPVPPMVDRTKPVGTGNQRGPTAEELSEYAAQKNKKPSAAEKLDVKGMNDKAQKALYEDPTALLGAGAAGLGLYKLGKYMKGAKKIKDAASPYLKELTMEPKKLGRALSDVTDVVAKKRGGKIKKYDKGGSVSSASRRADGIAVKGKTRGKMC